MKKEIPILFMTEMVQSILADNKTLTRRLCQYNKAYEIFHNGKRQVEAEKSLANLKPCKYKVGDILWVKETYLKVFTPKGDFSNYAYKADNDPLHSIIKWKPSLFMPKEASRIKLKITDIKVERLQEITEEDAIREGVKSKDSFKSLWTKINGAESWKNNPFVWVISFKKI